MFLFGFTVIFSYFHNKFVLFECRSMFWHVKPHREVGDFQVETVCSLGCVGQYGSFFMYR